MAAAMIARILTLAGSDSGGGAGIQADLKTFTALKTFGMTVITSITAQNTAGVQGILDLPPEMVTRQLESVATDIGIDAAKTGMLSNAALIEAVASGIERFSIHKLVVDPVMHAKGGDTLLRPEAQNALIEKILPLAWVVTPNIPEAEALARQNIQSPQQMQEAARRIAALGPVHVLIKGAHLGQRICRDLYFDGNRFEWLEVPRIPTQNTHGTGCTLSAAIAAYLGQGLESFAAIEKAKRYVTEAIRHSFSLGHGHGPLNHFWETYVGV